MTKLQHHFALSSFILILLYGFHGTLAAQDVSAKLVSEQDSIQAGQDFWVGVSMEMAPKWHTYWQNPGEIGRPTRLQWQLPEGFKASPIHWPTPHRFLQDGILNYVYEKHTLLLVKISPPADLKAGTPVDLKAEVKWLACDDSTCVPGSQELAISLPVTTQPSVFNEWQAQFNKTQESWPQELSAYWAVTASESADSYKLQLKSLSEGNKDVKEAYFFSQNKQVNPASKQSLIKTAEGYTLNLAKDKNYSGTQDQLTGILSAKQSWVIGKDLSSMAVAALLQSSAGTTAANATLDVEQSPGQETSETDAAQTQLGSLLLFAYIGGLILNLMPCVFPVLGLKIMSFVKQAGENRKKIMLHGLLFTGGVLMSFWVLAAILLVLRSAGHQIGWGFQLQEPGFVYALAVVLLLFGLNMSGVFEAGYSAMGVGSKLSSKSGLIGSFFSGVLATVVATPCAAPFLAPALGSALILPPTESFIIFTAMGIGLATPYLLLSIFPGLISSLPKPGAWMESFKQFLAFLLYASALALLWVLAGQVVPSLLLGIFLSMVVIAMAAWVYGRWYNPGKSKLSQQRTIMISAILLATPLVYVYWNLDLEKQKKETLALVARGEASADFIIWEKWSPQRVAELRKEKRLVFVDFTARWCATCQVNKRVFNNKAVEDAFVDNQFAMLKADWTNEDPQITQAMEQLGRSAVPVNVIYSPKLEKPLLLPELLTSSNVLEAINKAK